MTAFGAWWFTIERPATAFRKALLPLLRREYAGYGQRVANPVDMRSLRTS